MQNFNLHTHTWRCRHAIGLEQEYIEQAIQANLSVLGFSDHCPFYHYPNQPDRMDYDQKADYQQIIRNLQEKYRDQITILFGYEFEYLEDCLDEIHQLRAESDFLILGNHYKSTQFEDFGIVCSDDDLLHYGNQVCQAMKLGLCDLVAHPDYFMMGRNQWNATCDLVAQQICEAAVAYHIPLEINLNGVRYGKRQYQDGLRYCYPWKEFWDIATKVGCEAIYGLDAHDPQLFLQMQQRIELVNSFLDLKGLMILDTLPKTIMQSVQRRDK